MEMHTLCEIKTHLLLIVSPSTIMLDSHVLVDSIRNKWKSKVLSGMWLEENSSGK